MGDLERLFVSPHESIRRAIACIDENLKGVALVVDHEQRLLATITDGDVRRAMLAKLDLGASVNDLLAHKASTSRSGVVTAPVGSPRELLLQLMQERLIRQIPLLDDAGRVADLVTDDDLLPRSDLPLQAVVMAGGFGVRLRPMTEDLPKPMLPVGGRPLMERIIAQLLQTGIRRINVTTHYRRDKIIEHFGDGSEFGVELNYVNEERPLGTAGALGLLNGAREPLLVINGDILTQVDFRAMLAFHQESRAGMTVAVCRYDVQVPYGVIECDGPLVRRVTEKPSFNLFVNAGIYLIEPSVHAYIPNGGERFDMTDLIQRLLDAGRPVATFPIREYWLDIGERADYERAQTDVERGPMA